jgi:hypothetical protein
MAAREHHVTTVEITQMVDDFIDREHCDAAKYTNRTPLDDSGAFSLHQLAADIYALGFSEGQRVEMFRKMQEHQRAKDRAAAEMKARAQAAGREAAKKAGAPSDA